MIQIKATESSLGQTGPMWSLITSAPSGRSLELAVIDQEGVHALVFPCEKASTGWKNVATGVYVDIRPTHWRPWDSMKDGQDSSRNPT